MTTPKTCPICAGDRLTTLRAATGERAYCLTCFHGWRTETVPFGYADTSMCSLGTSARRLAQQIGFFAPFAPNAGAILEIGCATGELAAATRASLNPIRYDAIELSPAGETARTRVDRLYTHTLAELLAADDIARDYHLILMSHVLEHIPNPVAELASMLKVLRSDGAVFLEVPNGSGNRRLPIDDNATHLHFFSATSLSRLLANAGVEAIAVGTDARLDARYADSLQVVGRRFQEPTWSRTLLSDHPLIRDEGQVIVWGAGGLADDLLANFFDPARIAFFIDRDVRKQGGLCLGKPVRAPGAVKGAQEVVLIDSIDFADAIAADIDRLREGEPPARMIRIADLLE